MTLRAVLFDVDFTLAKPGPELMPEGYVRCGERHGLSLDAAAYEAARDAALVDLQAAPRARPRRGDLGRVHRADRARHGRRRSRRRTTSPSSSRAAGQRHENFELYEDVLPVLDELRAAG